MKDRTPAPLSNSHNIPSHEQCLEMIEDMNMWDNIVLHSKTVCLVADVLSLQLVGKGLSLNQPLTHAGALLHDITKSRAIVSKENHAKTGAEYIKERGYPEVSELIRQHVRLDSYFKTSVPCEAELVNYSDKRVLHDKIVSLDQRMAYILDVYGETPLYKDKIEELWGLSREMEKRIFSYVDFSPEALSDYCMNHI